MNEIIAQKVTAMNRMTVLSQVGVDGMLNISVPLGLSDANLPVQVTIEPAVNTPKSDSDYENWLGHIAGRWHGQFAWSAEGDFEIREPLS